MSDVIYQERQTIPMRGLILFLVAALGVATVLLTWPSDESLAAMLAFAAAFLAVWIFTALDVLVTSSGLRFGFSIFRKIIPRDRIEVGEIADIPFWYGMGIHYVRRTWVWNARLGRGVRIRSGRTNYLVGSAKPEQLQHALLQISPRRLSS